ALDMNICSDPTVTREISRMLPWAPIKPIEETAVYADAIDASLAMAIKDDIRHKGKQPPWWICAVGESNPSYERLAPEAYRFIKREVSWNSQVPRQKVLATEIRLNANLNPDHFEVWKLDSKYWKDKRDITRLVTPDPAFSVIWLDSDTLLFGGYFKLRRPDLKYLYDPIYKWKPVERQVSLYAEPGYGMCYFKGFLSYYIERDDKLFYREGAAGREVETLVGADEALRIGPGRSELSARMNCRRYSQSPHAPPIWQLETGGRLKSNGAFEKENRTLEYVPEGSNQPTVFDPFEGLANRIGNAYWMHFPPKYSAYLDAVWIEIIRGGSSIDSTPVWTLHRDGRVDKVDIPAGPWAASTYEPAKNGWFALSLGGLYFLSDNKAPVKILSGTGQGMRVSPNGCRVAVRLQEAQDRPMWVVDICSKGDRK
ncbi:MAG: hypothetical protein ABJB97_09635, partial [Acidobacteriota bacterium]